MFFGKAVWIKTLWFAYTVVQTWCQVVELDDSFLEVRGDDPWLVEFYAPWCGHCRRLQPVYHQVYLALQNSQIKVAKVDATKYTHIAAEYDVRGFPTIKFIQGDIEYTHRGDRTRDGIIEFAKRALGPQVRFLSNKGKFHDARSDHSHQVFFLYVGSLDPNGDVMTKYRSIAEKYAVLGYFYAIDRETLPKNYITHYEPSVLVFKDDTYFEYLQPDHGPTKVSLENWINGELYEAFPKISSGALNEMTELKKKLAMVIIDDKERIQEAKHDRFKEIGKILASQYRDRFHEHFQFLWMGDNESANQITMSYVDPPQIMVLDPHTQHYFWPPFSMDHANIQAVVEFLDSIINGTATVYGGTGFLKKIQRVGWDVYSTMYEEFKILPEMWIHLYDEAGWLAVMIFTVPCIAVGICCFAVCCMEPFDEAEFWAEYIEAAERAAAEKARLEALGEEGPATDSGSDTDPQQPLLPGAEGIAVETLPLEALSQEVLPEDGIGEAVASDAHAKHD